MSVRKPINEDKPAPDINEQNTESSVDSSASASIMPEQISQYRIDCLLGRGGMGQVYKAYDTQLQRYVALKLLRTDDPELRPRFLQEARIQAGIDHEHICKVHDVGEMNGKPYIVMQFIEGCTFTEAMSQMNVEQKVRVTAAVADAVHAAHEHGLIHRDIKPSNIMVIKTSENDWKPFVLDFGVARQIGGPKLTATGVPLGTPDYMPPEQARGEIKLMDGRSDVYSIGATMYMVLTGHTPHEGNSAFEVLTRLLHDDPVPLRKWNPDLPGELEIIVMKCLEKDAANRYATAEDLARDLKLFLEGEPISARPATIMSRVRRKIQRNRLATASIALAIMITVSLILTLLWMQARSKREAFYTQLFGYEIQMIESTLRDVYSAPLHDVRSEVAGVQVRLKAIEAKMKEVSPLADAPGHLALGRGHLALGEQQDALTHLQMAWDAGLQQPATAYALGKTLGALYQRSMEQTDAIQSPTVRSAVRQDLTRKYRDPAVKFLTLSRDTAESPQYVEGLIALYEGRFTEALQKAQAAARQAQWSYDAKKLTGDAQSEIAREHMEKGAYDLVLEALTAASGAYHQAAELGRSREEIYLSGCHAWTTMMHAQTLRGESPTAALQKANELCDHALQINPEGHESYLQRAKAYQTLGTYLQYNSGEDPRPTLQQSIQLAAEAARRKPSEATAYDIGGFSHARIGEYELTHGLDPSISLQHAIALSTRSLELEPLNIVAINHLGVAYSMNAEHLWKRGGDALGSFRKAVEQYERASSIQPDDSYAPFNAGIANWFMGSYKMAHGQDPSPEFNKAIRQFERTLELAPNDGATLNNLGIVYSGIAEFQRVQGADPLSSFEKSIALRKQALEQTRNNAYLHVGVCGVLVNLADHQLSRNSDPSQSLAEARIHCDKAISISPTYYETYDETAKIERIAALWKKANGGNPLLHFDESDKLLQKALDHNPEEATIFLHRAQLYRDWAEWMAVKSQPGREHEYLLKSMEWIEKAVAQTPMTADFLALRADLCARLARKEKNAAQREQYLKIAESSIQEAIRINSFLQKQYAHLLKETL